MERKGAAYRVKATRPAGSHAEHEQVTKTTSYYNNLAGAMDARTREYESARAGRMTAEEMQRVDIDPRMYPSR